MDGQSVITDPTGKEITYIIARNQGNPRYLQEILTQALVYEKLLAAPPGHSSL